MSLKRLKEGKVVLFIPGKVREWVVAVVVVTFINVTKLFTNSTSNTPQNEKQRKCVAEGRNTDQRKGAQLKDKKTNDVFRSQMSTGTKQSVFLSRR